MINLSKQGHFIVRADVLQKEHQLQLAIFLVGDKNDVEIDGVELLWEMGFDGGLLRLRILTVVLQYFFRNFDKHLAA